jgi:hypothetical protein
LVAERKNSRGCGIKEKRPNRFSSDAREAPT